MRIASSKDMLPECVAPCCWASCSACMVRLCRQEPQPEVEPETEHPASADLRSYIQDGEGMFRPLNIGCTRDEARRLN